MNVLVVEPDPFSAEVVTLRLEQLGCRVRLARTLDGALAAARAEAPDMILTELELDGDPESGVELLRRLSGDAATRDVPVVLHSIYALLPADVPHLLGSVAGLLPKPFRKEELKAIVCRLRPTLCAAG